MDGNQMRISPSIQARSAEFLTQAKLLTARTSSREDALQLIFGLDGPYRTLFPTIDDRLALRDLPARSQVFVLVCKLPVRQLPSSAHESPRE